MAQPCELASAWQPFVDQLTDNKFAKYAAICGLNGGVWATSPGFNITQDQILHLASGFDPNNQAFKCQRLEFEIIYKRIFQIIRNDENLIIAQSKANSMDFVASKTKTAMVIGITDATITLSQCMKNVVNMADYLIEQGY